jgi:hypothetical protein
MSELFGLDCAPCGGVKEPKRTFCRKCYYSLPPRLRKALYARVGAGYAEAYDEARAFLRSRAMGPAK